MIQTLFKIGIVLVIVFVLVLLFSLMTWVVSKVIRSLFPAKFSVSPRRESDIT